MRISNTENSNLNFGLLRIRIKGKPFKDHPESAKIIKNAILNNEGICDFFSNHRGKMVITAKETVVPVNVEYPGFLSRRPHETFTVNRSVPSIDINCTYHRVFALRNLFRKPVHVNAGTGRNSRTTWKDCVEDILDLIKMLGKDTPESIKRRGDVCSRDFASVEARRLKVEKP